jgi:uncharacterized protein (DUF305 family)
VRTRCSAVVALLAVLMLAGGCGTARPAAETAPAATAAVSPEFDAADVTFVRTLIPHHREGVALARLGATKAARADVRLLAGAIVATQEDEAQRMAGWLVAWKQPPAPAASAGPAGALRATGFDPAFLDALIAHQEGAITIAQAELAAGRNRNALAFARQVVESRTAQVDQLRADRAQ